MKKGFPLAYVYFVLVVKKLEENYIFQKASANSDLKDVKYVQMYILTRNIIIYYRGVTRI